MFGPVNAGQLLLFSVNLDPPVCLLNLRAIFQGSCHYNKYICFTTCFWSCLIEIVLNDHKIKYD